MSLGVENCRDLNRQSVALAGTAWPRRQPHLARRTRTAQSSDELNLDQGTMLTVGEAARSVSPAPASAIETSWRPMLSSVEIVTPTPP